MPIDRFTSLIELVVSTAVAPTGSSVAVTVAVLDKTTPGSMSDGVATSTWIVTDWPDASTAAVGVQVTLPPRGAPSCTQVPSPAGTKVADVNATSGGRLSTIDTVEASDGPSLPAMIV